MKNKTYDKIYIFLVGITYLICSLAIYFSLGFADGFIFSVVGGLGLLIFSLGELIWIKK